MCRGVVSFVFITASTWLLIPSLEFFNFVGHEYGMYNPFVFFF